MNTIFEKYKNNKISLYDAIKALDIANETNNKKTEGVIYTPRNISDYIVSNLGYHPSKTIIEPSVGHGVFIFSLIDYVKKNFNLEGEELKQWFETSVYCFDINNKNIEDLKTLLTLYFEKNNIFNISFKNVHVGDTLFYDFEHDFDFAFGNPPYVRTKNLEIEYLSKLREKFYSCKTGNVDLYYAFIELMNTIADKSSFIVPNSYIYNASARSLREEIKNNIISVIDFKSELIFENARTYTSIYITNRLKASTFIEYKESLTNKSILVNKENLDDKHWVFTESIFDKEGKTSIVDLYDCYSSIATLKDKLYIIESPLEFEENGVYYYEQYYNDKVYKIEKSLCIDFFKITKMDKSFKIIYPYINNEIIQEDKLKENYPFAYEYFKAIRSILDQRDKGKVDKYESWYAYGRKQGLQKKINNYYLFLPLMATKEYRCHKIEHPENFLLTSGFVLGFDTEEEADKVKLVLESGIFFDYIKTKGKPWAGKNPYYSFSKTHLKDFYI